ncbi:unnamed protein product [Xylocopa violacea]|uniref:Uncharacterized protein n=1 Tax=Xylocopa violacea TaxID=135666 RepID=A0ABP1MZB2_XYLVO
MSCFTAWIVALLILIGSVWSQREAFVKVGEPSPRFGFDLLESLRKSFCTGLCSWPDRMPYLMQLACSAKCPELYLPQQTTTTSTMQPSSASMTPNTSPTQSTPTSPTNSAPPSTAPTQPPTTMMMMPSGSNSTQGSGSNSTQGSGSNSTQGAGGSNTGQNNTSNP